MNYQKINRNEINQREVNPRKINLRIMNGWMVGLTMVYTLFLIWVILFKLNFSLSGIEWTRSINLIPFYNDGKGTVEFHIMEVVDNSLIFAPLGVLLGMRVSNKARLWHMLLPIPLLSLTLEVFQYVFAVGRSDITDVLANTFGGAIGMAFYLVLAKCVRNRERLRLWLLVILSVGMLVVIGGLYAILALNERGAYL